MPILMDIGANKGDWTAKSLAILATLGKKGLIHAFEPTEVTYAVLFNRFMVDDSVKLHRTALSDHSGAADFFVVGPLDGTNSLHRIEGAAVERVQTQRFDDVLASAGLEEVLFVKCDTEGSDMSVLIGAEQSLRRGRIELWQFEYNHRWVSRHHTLKDVFALIQDMPYRLGKLHGNGIELYEGWHPELERYFEGNYVLIRKESEIEKLGVVMRFDRRNVLVPIERAVAGAIRGQKRVGFRSPGLRR
jgi:FkbM family methyltransferase